MLVQILEENAQAHALRNIVLRVPIGLSLFDEDLTHESGDITFAAYEHEAMIGCVMLKPISSTVAKLRQMAVLEEYRNKKVGSALLHFFEAYCKTKRFGKIVLHARADALSFYKKAGFVANDTAFMEVGILHYAMQKEI